MIRTLHHRTNKVTVHNSWHSESRKKREMASPKCKKCILMKQNYITAECVCVCVCVCVCAAFTALPAFGTRRKMVGHFVYSQQLTVAAHWSRRQRTKRQEYVCSPVYPRSMVRFYFVKTVWRAQSSCNIAPTACTTSVMVCYQFQVGKQ